MGTTCDLWNNGIIGTNFGFLDHSCSENASNNALVNEFLIQIKFPFCVKRSYFGRRAGTTRGTIDTAICKKNGILKVRTCLGWLTVKFHVGTLIDKILFRVLDLNLFVDGISNNFSLGDNFAGAFRSNLNAQRIGGKDGINIASISYIQPDAPKFRDINLDVWGHNKRWNVSKCNRFGNTIFHIHFYAGQSSRGI